MGILILPLILSHGLQQLVNGIGIGYRAIGRGVRGRPGHTNKIGSGTLGK
jgi:hypothetical protein